MTERRFPIFGETIPPLIGRQKLLEQVSAELTKVTPSHVSIVGARFMGLSTFLKELENRLSGKYVSIIYWDLGHKTPLSDNEFIAMLSEVLGNGLKNVGNDYGDHLLDAQGGEYEDLQEVLDALQDDSEKVLLLLDGFDRPVTSGRLTRNLWDNLLELCRNPSFRLVTGSRKPLHDLIRDEESVTSDFWGIFGSRQYLKPFSTEDIDEILLTIPEYPLSNGAKAELLNWTGGIPPLVFEVLNNICELTPEREIDNTTLNAAAKYVSSKRQDVLSILWDECKSETKDLFQSILTSGGVLLRDAGRLERDILIERGFCGESGNKLVPTCRMLSKFLEGDRPDAGSLARLFTREEDFITNIRELLERRLGQIQRFDGNLFRDITTAISLLNTNCNFALNGLSQIEDRIFDVVWRAELDQNRTIPETVKSYWESGERASDSLVLQLGSNLSWTIPNDRNIQVRILQMLTGSKMKFDYKARSVSKSTYALIDALHGYRNLVQHLDGQEVMIGVAVAILMTCVELLANIAIEIE
jgi:hypothetical protein